MQSDPERKPNDPKSEFTMGFLLATATVARAGQDTLAVEMLAECGIRFPWELNGRGLQPFDKKPLYRVLKQELGRSN